MTATLALRYCDVNSTAHMAFGLAYSYRPAMDIIAIRKARLLWLAEMFGGYKQGGFAKLGAKVSKDPNVFSQIHTGNRGMGNRMARYLEKELGLDHGIMDSPLEADMRRQQTDELIKIALGERALNPGIHGLLRMKPGPIKAGARRMKGNNPKEEPQPAPSVASSKGRKRGAK